MSETLSRRVGRLVSGGFHALIDAAENLAPEAVMNESIREIERAVDEVRAELGKVLARNTLPQRKWPMKATATKPSMPTSKPP